MTPDLHIAYAAGILPFALYKGTVVFLVGKDAQDGLWSDFGGKYETKDRTELETAQREFIEETCGCVLDMRALKMRMNHTHHYRVLTSLTQSKHPYYTHVIQVPFDPMVRSIFRRTTAFLRFLKLPRGVMEKVDLRWVTLDGLKQLSCRSVFQSSMTRHEDFFTALAQTGRLPDTSSSSSPSISTSARV